MTQYTAVPQIVQEDSNIEKVIESYDILTLLLPEKEHVESTLKATTLPSELQKTILALINIKEDKEDAQNKNANEPLRLAHYINGKKLLYVIISVANKCKDSKDNCDLIDALSKAYNEIGNSVAMFGTKYKASKIAIYMPNIKTEQNGQHISISVASGLIEKIYSFSKYFTKKKDKATKLQTVGLMGVNTDMITLANQKLSNIYIARDLVNEPANELYPETYVDRIKGLLPSNVEVTVLDKNELEKIGMHMLLGVSLGSDKPPYVVVMKYNGNKKKEDIDLALVGKGITFDSGGLSIKPAQYMEEMKSDMAGSAVVVGTMKLLAERNANANVYGIVGLVENSVNGMAQRPGDVVKSLSGQTVEILNTDAEGRLILGDILYYIITKYKPKHVIDLATLTGAISVSLANVYAGLFSNNDELSKNLIKASEKSQERLWRLPMGPEYDAMIDSNIADLKNTGSGSAGSTTAAQFLQRFIDDAKSWAHLDIAGVAYDGKKGTSNAPSGATGFGVKLLNTFIADYLE